MSLRRLPWPNHMGFTFLNEKNEEVLDVHVLAGRAGEVNLQSLRQIPSMCGVESVKHFSLDQTCELGLGLNPENLPGETLLALVNEHGEGCG